MRPIVKWAGGKSKLLPELTRRLPTSFNNYFEPFFGGGALFFSLRPFGRSILTDMNHELINFYQIVRDQPRELIGNLAGYTEAKEEDFYATRGLDPDSLPPVAAAARFFYLNRTCFNGLYRVNKANKFNVPYGKYTNPDVCPADKILAASNALANTNLIAADYTLVADLSKPGDFVYFDPPYVPVSKTSNFTGYTAGGFGSADQTRLACLFDELTDRGVHCMLSNSDTPETCALYAEHNIESIMAPRRVGGNRKPVAELIVRNYQ